MRHEGQRRGGEVRDRVKKTGEERKSEEKWGCLAVELASPFIMTRHKYFYGATSQGGAPLCTYHLALT